MVSMSIVFKDITYNVTVKQEFQGRIIIEFHNEILEADSYEESNKLGLQLLLRRFQNGETANISVVEMSKVLKPGDPLPMMNPEQALGRDVSFKDLSEATIMDVEKLIIDECHRRTSFPDIVIGCQKHLLTK